MEKIIPASSTDQDVIWSVEILDNSSSAEEFAFWAYHPKGESGFCYRTDGVNTGPTLNRIYNLCQQEGVGDACESALIQNCQV